MCHIRCLLLDKSEDNSGAPQRTLSPLHPLGTMPETTASLCATAAGPLNQELEQELIWGSPVAIEAEALGQPQRIFFLLRHRGHASAFAQPAFFPSSNNKEIAKEFKKTSPVNTQAEPLVNLHAAFETRQVKLLGIGKSV